MNNMYINNLLIIIGIIELIAIIGLLVYIHFKRSIKRIKIVVTYNASSIDSVNKEVFHEHDVKEIFDINPGFKVSSYTWSAGDKTLTLDCVEQTKLVEPRVRYLALTGLDTSIVIHES